MHDVLCQRKKRKYWWTTVCIEIKFIKKRAKKRRSPKNTTATTLITGSLHSRTTIHTHIRVIARMHADARRCRCQCRRAWHAFVEHLFCDFDRVAYFSAVSLRFSFIVYTFYEIDLEIHTTASSLSRHHGSKCMAAEYFVPFDASVIWEKKMLQPFERVRFFSLLPCFNVSRYQFEEIIF